MLFVVAPSLGADETYQVVADRRGPGEPVTYRVIASDAGPGRSGEFSIVDVDGQFIVVTLGGLPANRERLEMYLRHRMWEYRGQSSMVDIDGDGIFDSVKTRRVDSRIRFGDSLVKVRNWRGLPIREAVNGELVAITDFGAPKYNDQEYEFIGNRWSTIDRTGVGKGWRGFAPNRSYTIPKVAEQVFPEVPNYEPDPVLEKRLANLPWKPSKRATRVEVSLESELARLADGILKIRFRTYSGLDISIAIRGGRVLEWNVSDRVRQAFYFDGTGQKSRMKLRVGRVEYIDADGDGVFDSFHNPDANEWVLINHTELIRAREPADNADDHKSFVSSDGSSILHLNEGHWSD